MRTTAGHTGDRPEDGEAPGAVLVRGAATDRIPALADLGRVHIMGIAGSGMSALARILFGPGCRAAAARPGSRSPWPGCLNDRHQPPARGARRRAGEISKR
jgi:hypothetical protein